MFLLALPLPAPNKFWIHYLISVKFSKWKEVSKIPDFFNGSLNCIDWRPCVAPRDICLLHKNRLIGLGGSHERAARQPVSVWVLTVPQTRTADPFSLLGYVCPAVTVFLFYLLDFHKKHPGCEVIYMQYGWQGDQDAGVSVGAELLDNGNNFKHRLF